MFLAAAVAAACASEQNPAATGEGGKSPTLAALLATLPKWSASASLEVDYGYKDNLLLSAAEREESPFFRSAAEALLMRVPTGRVDYTLFAQTEASHYTAGEAVDHEASAWLQSDAGFRPGGGWKLSLPLTGYLFDQVFDVSETEVERLVAELKVRGFMAGPAVRWEFRPDFWVEAQGVADRKTYEDRVNDCRVREAALRFGWRISERVDGRLSAFRRWRDFDSRVQYSAAGRALPGTRLKVDESEGEARLNVKWDRAGHWQTVTRLAAMRYQDSGSGYFDRNERRVDCELEWSREKWAVRINGEARRVDFGVQTVGLGLDPPARLKEEYTVEVRVERKVSASWSVVAGGKWERSRSNDQVASYRVNEGLLGARWSWEK